MKLALNIPTGSGLESTEVPVPSGLPSGLSGDFSQSGGAFLQVGVNYAFTGAIILAVVFIIISGIGFITSGGDAIKLSRAKSSLLYSIIGLVVVVGAFFIVKVVIFLAGGNPDFFLKLR